MFGWIYKGLVKRTQDVLFLFLLLLLLRGTIVPSFGCWWGGRVPTERQELVGSGAYYTNSCCSCALTPAISLVALVALVAFATLPCIFATCLAVTLPSAFFVDFPIRCLLLLFCVILSLLLAKIWDMSNWNIILFCSITQSWSCLLLLR